MICEHIILLNYFSIKLFGHSGSSMKKAMQAFEPAVATMIPKNPSTEANNLAIFFPPFYLFKHYCLNHNFYNCYKED